MKLLLLLLLLLPLLVLVISPQLLGVEARLVSLPLNNDHESLGFAPLLRPSSALLGLRESFSSSPLGDDSSFPGIPLNQSFVLSCLDTDFRYVAPFSEEFSSHSIIFHVYNEDLLEQQALWTANNSIANLLLNTPANETILVFLSASASDEEEALEDALFMRGMILSTLETLVSEGSNKLQWSTSSNLFFVNAPLSTLLSPNSSVSVNATWIPEFLANNNWTSTTNQIMIPWVPLPPIPRLDANWPFDVLTFPTSSVKLAYFGTGCNDTSPVQNITGNVAIASGDDCPYFDKIYNAQNMGAIGIIVYPTEGPVVAMNCYNNESCDTEITIPATMVSYENGVILQSLTELVNGTHNGSVFIEFQTVSATCTQFAIDTQGLLQSLGWIQYPDFQFYAWAAQGFAFKSTLLQTIENTKAVVVPIFDNVPVDNGWNGFIQANSISLPEDPTSLFENFDLELDATIGCADSLDSSCQPWDRIHSLTVCCENSGDQLCNSEIGRWINSFGRRGRWITEVTPLMPLFTSQVCNFTYSTVGVANYFYITINLRFIPKTNTESESPRSIIPLFQGGSFNQQYNNRTPIIFEVPEYTTKAYLVATITGHGSDNYNCAEFCVTSHHFVFNGHENSRTFENAGTAFGCAERTPEGVVPNEYGTWLYGRNGWCDGLQVNPWVVDVTSQLNLTKGAANNVTYFGWFEGHTPDPQPGGSAMIDMSSYLVYYTSSQ